MADWQQTYDPRDLIYLSANKKQIADTASRLGVPALGLVGGIAREMAYARNVDPNHWWTKLSEPVKDFMTSKEYDSSNPDVPAWKPITHQTLADAFARSNQSGGSIEPGADFARLARLKFQNPVLWDVGPGHVNIRTAITMLQNYNRLFPDSDPLDLKQYNRHYDLLVRDLKNPDNDATIKIAGLVAREGQDFFAKAMTPESWAMLSDDQRAAALTQYYVTGKERMEDDFQKRGGDPNTYTPDLSREGSNTYLYDGGTGNWSNPALLKNVFSPVLRTQNDSASQPTSTAESGADTSNAAVGPDTAAQRTTAFSVPAQPLSGGLPPQVVATGNYLRANGIAITPRTVYMSHVIGPERTADVIRRTGSTFSPDVPSADATTGDQVRAWVRALRGLPPAAPAGNGGSAQADDATVQPPMPAPTPAPPVAPGAFAVGDGAADTSAVTNVWPQ